MHVAYGVPFLVKDDLGLVVDSDDGIPQRVCGYEPLLERLSSVQPPHIACTAVLLGLDLIE